MADSRIADRLQRGIGAGYPANQKLSGGFSEEAAERQAKIARGEIEDVDPLTPVEAVEPEKEEIPPPSTEKASEEEVLAATRIAAMLSETSARLSDRDPLMDDNSKMRAVIESQLPPIDVGRLLFDDYAEQNIPLFQGQVHLRLRTLDSQWVTLIDRWIYEIVGVSMTLPTKQKIRLLLIVAMTILEVNGKPPGDRAIPTETPSIFMRKFKPVSELFEARLEWLLLKNPAIVDLFLLNVTWFEQRVRRTVHDAQFMAQEIKKS